jgi:hypothetical protein
MGPGYCVATLRNVFIVAQSKPSDVPYLLRLRHFTEQFHARNPGTNCAISLITPSALSLSSPPEVRAEIERLFRDFRNCSGSATVIEGSGFKVTAVRMLLSGISLMQRLPYPTRIVSSVADAAAFIAPISLGGKANVIEHAELREAIEDARRHMGSLLDEAAIRR